MYSVNNWQTSRQHCHPVTIKAQDKKKTENYRQIMDFPDPAYQKLDQYIDNEPESDAIGNGICERHENDCDK